MVTVHLNALGCHRLVRVVDEAIGELLGRAAAEPRPQPHRQQLETQKLLRELEVMELAHADALPSSRTREGVKAATHAPP